jgi:hypothetical protein
VDRRHANWYNSLMILDVNDSYLFIFAGLPHHIETDDIYNGYLVPGGSIIIPNQWSLSYPPSMPVR